MSFKRGDIVLVLFPYADHQTVKKRPALIVQADNLNTEFPQFILARITHEMKRAGLNCRVSLLKKDPKYKTTKLHQDSVLMTDHLATLGTALIDKKIGEITDMTAVDTALRATLSL